MHQSTSRGTHEGHEEERQPVERAACDRGRVVSVNSDMHFLTQDQREERGGEEGRERREHTKKGDGTNTHSVVDASCASSKRWYSSDCPTD